MIFPTPRRRPETEKCYRHGMGLFRRFFGSAGSRVQDAMNRARDHSFQLGEAERQRAEQQRQQEQERCEDVRRERDWRRQIDEAELEEQLKNVEIPPRILSEDEAWAESGEWLSVISGNVAAIQYHAEDQRLLIEYKDGSFYAYQPVPIHMALDFHRAGSKGTWVWDHLRVRGTVFGYQIPYAFLSGPSQPKLGQEARLWMRTQETRRKHGAISPSGRDALGLPIKPRHIC